MARSASRSRVLRGARSSTAPPFAASAARHRCLGWPAGSISRYASRSSPVHEGTPTLRLSLRGGLQLLGLAAVVALIVVTDRFLGPGEWLHVERVRALVAQAGPAAPLAFIAVCVAGILLHLPEIVLIAIGGVLFGKLGGFFYGWIGGVLGAALTFVIARVLLRDAMQRALITRSKRLQALDTRLAAHGFVTVLGLRLLLFFAPPLNWALGATRVRTRDYLAGSILGVIPGVVLTVALADAVATAGSLSALLTPEIVGFALLLAAFGVGSVVVTRRWLARPSPPGG